MTQLRGFGAKVWGNRTSTRISPRRIITGGRPAIEDLALHADLAMHFGINPIDRVHTMSSSSDVRPSG